MISALATVELGEFDLLPVTEIKIICSGWRGAKLNVCRAGFWIRKPYRDSTAIAGLCLYSTSLSLVRVCRVEVKLGVTSGVRANYCWISTTIHTAEDNRLVTSVLQLFIIFMSPHPH